MRPVQAAGRRFILRDRQIVQDRPSRTGKLRAMPRASKGRNKKSACNIQIGDDEEEAGEEAGLLSDRGVDRWERDCRSQAPTMAAFDAAMVILERGDGEPRGVPRRDAAMKACSASVVASCMGCMLRWGAWVRCAARRMRSCRQQA